MRARDKKNEGGIITDPRVRVSGDRGTAFHCQLLQRRCPSLVAGEHPQIQRGIQSPNSSRQAFVHVSRARESLA